MYQYGQTVKICYQVKIKVLSCWDSLLVCTLNKSGGHKQLIVSGRKLDDGDADSVEDFSLVQLFVPFGF